MNDSVIIQELKEENSRLQERVEKQRRLLVLYRELAKALGLTIVTDTTDTWDGYVDYEYLEINMESKTNFDILIQIEKLESEIKSCPYCGQRLDWSEK